MKDESFLNIKKESPNEGTETRLARLETFCSTVGIKKESPNEGTETKCKVYDMHSKIIE